MTKIGYGTISPNMRVHEQKVPQPLELTTQSL